MPNPIKTDPMDDRYNNRNSSTTSTNGQEPDSAAAATDNTQSRRSSMSEEHNPNETAASTHNEQRAQQARDLRQYLTGGAGAAATDRINKILNNEAAHPKDLTAENKRRIEALTQNIPTWEELVKHYQNATTGLDDNQYAPSVPRQEQRNPNNGTGLFRQDAMTEEEAERIRNISQGLNPLERQDATSSESTLDPEAQRYYADTLGIFGDYSSQDKEDDSLNMRPQGPGNSS